MEFLTKPILLTNGVFSVTDNYSFLQSISLPFSAFSTTQGTLWKEKLKGYFGMRMDMRLRIVVNANKFQQGRYILGWVPIASGVKSSSQLKHLLTNNLHMATLVQRTTVPHIEIDLCKNTTAEMLIPFVSPHNFYPLNSLLGTPSDVATLGYLNIYPYSPLVSPTGSTTASYTVYITFENIQLFGAASAQSGLFDRELTSKMNGPVSGVAMSISKGFNEFANIPLLSSYALPISWISDRIAKTACMFGFSKPSQGDSSTKVTLINSTNQTTVDGDSDCRSLALINKPAVSLTDGIGGTSFDEMDFSYVARKYSWFRTLSWSINDTVGTLTSIDVAPSTGVYETSSVYHHAPVAFISRMFHYWRGSVKFRFKLVKTDFHSGRLAFCFYPTDEISLTGNAAYVNRTIVDIRESSELEFVIPYISRKPWTLLGQKIGVFTIEVVDLLVAPASVSNSITILSEIAGGDDIEFAVPSRMDLSIRPIVPQSGLVNDDRLVRTTIGSSSVTANPIALSSTCIGEKISSFRSLLKRFIPLRLSDVGGETTIDFNGREAILKPDAILATDVVPTGTYIYSDMFSLIASCYALVGGGVRVRDIIDIGLSTAEANSTNTNLFCYMEPNTGGTNTLTPVTSISSITGSSNTVPCFYQNILQNNCITAEVPQYTTTFTRSKSDIITYQGASNILYGYNNSSESSCSHMDLSFVLPYSFSSSISSVDGYNVHNLFRSASDDCNFSCFISVPPLVGDTQVINKGLY